MYRVLLPIDEIESRARTQAESILDQPGSSEFAVDICHVHDDVSAPDAEWAAGGFSETYAEEMAEQVGEADRLPKSVAAAVDILEASDVECTLYEESGDPAETILERAEDLDSDVIVLGVGKHSPVGKVLFGSVVQAVILESDRPVTVVPAESE